MEWNNNQTKLNWETSVANRSHSFFSAFGDIISYFYLEAGIYFVGLLNASLVAWEIYSDLILAKKPWPLAFSIGIIALIAVEGLAVYLVGAAAKTGHWFLWVCSVAFALFFTFAHVRELYTPGVVQQYVTIAIPFFVVIGYWAREVKNKADTITKTTELEAQQERQRQQKIEDEDRQRQQKIEDEERAWQRQQDALKSQRAHELKLTKASVKELSKSGQNNVKNGDFDTFFDTSLDNVNTSRQTTKAENLERLEQLMEQYPEATQAFLAAQLGVSRQTIYNYQSELNHQTNGATS